jgi:hypothetical protein
VTDPEHVVEAHTLARIAQIEWEIKQEAKLDTLRGLLQLAESEPVDADFLRKLIDAIENETGEWEHDP